MSQQSVVIGGRPVGRIKAGWILFKETFRFAMLDKEMLWVPIITGVVNFFLLGVIFFASFILVIGGNLNEDSYVWYLVGFLCYFVGAFTVAFSQAAISYTVYTRVKGGDATLGQGLSAALSHIVSLFFWSLITSTVGMLLRYIAERSKLGVMIVTALVGIAWSILTYFVVPSIVIGNRSAPAAIGDSARVFKHTWGETAVSNFSYTVALGLLSLVFFFMMFGIMMVSISLDLWFMLSVGFGVLVLWIIAMAILASVLGGVLRALIYIYATESAVPVNFNSELIEKMFGTGVVARHEEESEPVPQREPYSYAADHTEAHKSYDHRVEDSNARY